MAPASRPRALILTLSIAAITATGAWYGAGLKTRSEIKQVCNPSRNISFFLLSAGWDDVLSTVWRDGIG